jgi:glutathione synthase/RimK-type ligase-like ATP-grasp enzyme
MVISMILMMSGHRDDPTVLALATVVEQRGAEAVVIDATMLQRACISLPFGIRFATEPARCISARDVTAAFLWRSSVPMAHDPMLDPVRDDQDSTRFVLAQWSKLSRGLWHALEHSGVRCVNRATSVAVWEDKVTQLIAADAVGLSTPPTRYLCDLSTAADFADVHGGHIVYKPFTPYLGPPRVEGKMTELYSQVLSARELRAQANDALVPTPGIFQPYVAKAFELRVVYVGGSIFACRIESQQSDIARQDWRRYDLDNTPHLAHELDTEVGKRVIDLMERMDLQFGSIDFIVTPEGEHVFLEVNPVGQFGWIVAQTGFPIYERLADLLIGGA